tara:strand:- start:10364 stop:10969 length:606 start_codon:yes stop_codon:yes gene_type:complete
MKRFISFLKTTLIGGVFLIVPIVIVLIILGKVIEILRVLVKPIVKKIPLDTIGGITVARLTAVLVLIFICLLAGLLAKTKSANQLKDWIESTLLSNIPGYSMIKGMTETAIGIESSNENEIMLVNIEETWQLGILMDQVDDELFTIFLPGAPSPMSGDVVFVKKERLKKLDISSVEAFKIQKKLGVGSAAILKGKINSKSF